MSLGVGGWLASFGGRNDLMPDRGWKAFERRVARLFGGQRRGPDTRGPHAGKTDVIHPHYAIEVKLLGRPSFSDLLSAVKQAELNAEPHQEPIAVVKRKDAHDQNALVVMRLPTFMEWRL